MPQALAAVLPSIFAAGGTVALTTAAGGLTIAGAVVSVASSLAISAALQRGNRPAAVQPENIALNIKQAIGDRIKHIGRVKSGGTIVFFRTREGKFYRVLVHGHGMIDGIEELYLDDNLVTLDGSNYVLEEQFTADGEKRVQIITRVGATPATPYNLLTDIWPAWDEDHRLDGLWTSLTIAESVDAEDFGRVYPNREPSLSIVARGTRFRDPRTGTTAWSQNAALAIADLIEDPDFFNLAGFVDDDVLAIAADNSDDEIPLAAGGTEPRWRFSGSYALTEQPGTVLRRMLTCCGGEVKLLPTGKIGIYEGKVVTPDVTLRFDELISIDEWTSGPDKIGRYTELPFTYVDPDLAYQPTTGDTWVDLDRETANGGQAAVGTEADYSFSPSHPQCRRLAQLQIERDNPAYEITARFKPSARRALYERRVILDVPQLPAVTWQVTGYRLSLADGGVTLKLAAFEPPAWSSGYEGQPQVLPEPDEERAIPAPTGFAAAGAGVQTAQNGFTAGIGVVWDPRPSAALSPVMQYAPAGTGEWDDWPLAAKTRRTTIAPLVDQEDYDVRIAYRTSDELYSPWVMITSVTAAADADAPAPPTGLAVSDETSGNARVTLTTSTSANLWRTRIYRDGALVATSYAAPGEAIAVIDASGAGTFDWTARSFNVSGLPSGTDAGPVTQTIT